MKAYTSAKTIRGYMVHVGKGLDKLTVSRIYNGEATCYLNESRPRYYKSKAAAEKIARQITAGEIRIK